MTTRAMRTRSLGLFSPIPWTSTLLTGIFFACGMVDQAYSQEYQTETSEPIVFDPHRSRYQAPTTYPEGTELHIIAPGDTLWDLSDHYHQDPFLWPQLWDANRYIENPHLIYPGDSVRIPELDVVRSGLVAPGTSTGPYEALLGSGAIRESGPEGQPRAPSSKHRGSAPIPAYEEIGIQCANYVGEADDQGFRIFGSEEGEAKDNLSTGDVVYLNRGLRDGINPGEMYYSQRRFESPGYNNKFTERTSWLTILAVQEKTSMAEITQACAPVLIGDYLTPYEPIPVPLLSNQPAPTRMAPETGRMRGEIVVALEDQVTLGAGYLVSINLGEEDGVVPGNLFTIFRYVYSDAPRKVLGELAVLTVQRRNATARIVESWDFIDIGDLIELK